MSEKENGLAQPERKASVEEIIKVVEPLVTSQQEMSAAERMSIMRGVLQELRKLQHQMASVDHGKTNVEIRHWSLYDGAPVDNTHVISVTDQRSLNGQLYLEVGVRDGNIDDMLGVTLEVNTSPKTKDHVPCVHVSFDGDNSALALFRVGDDILLRHEQNVTLSRIGPCLIRVS